MPTELRLLPAGVFRARDGRPHGAAGGWRIDAAIAARLIDRARSRQDAFVIDYEHQTLHTERNGQPAPAAGWIRPASLEWRDDGLYATDIQWTDRARELIAGGEYRYLSPVFSYDQTTGEVFDLVMAAVTNHAGIDGLDDLTARAAARFSFDDLQEGNQVNEKLLKLLGLAQGATEEQIEAAIVALKAKADAAQAAQEELNATKTALAAAKAEVGKVDPAKYVPIDAVNELQKEVAALRAQVDGREVDELVATALEDGRLVPAMEGWARDLGKTNIAALKSYLEAATPIAALKGTQTGGQGPRDKDGTGLTDVQLAVCRQMGVSPEEYKKALAESAS